MLEGDSRFSRLAGVQHGLGSNPATDNNTPACSNLNQWAEPVRLVRRRRTGCSAAARRPFGLSRRRL